MSIILTDGRAGEQACG